MPRTTATIPDDLTDLMEGAVRPGIFENESDDIFHVLREYFEENQNDRIAAAVSLYDDEEIAWVPLHVSPASTGSKCGTYCERRVSNSDSVPKTWTPRETRSKLLATSTDRAAEKLTRVIR